MTALSVQLVIALAVLAALAVVVAALSRLTAVLGRVAWALAFAVVMLGVAVGTSARRIGAGSAWPWVLLAIASGAVPVLVVIFVSGAVPWNGAAIVPMAGIIIGGA